MCAEQRKLNWEFIIFRDSVVLCESSDFQHFALLMVDYRKITFK